MRALVWGGRQGLVELRDDVPPPQLIYPTDAVCRVLLAGICGSDLHPYHLRERGLARGTVLGHEFVGIVTEVGSQVRHVRVGDRVACPFTTCCGQCFYCQRGMQCRCSHPHAHLLGWISEGEKPGGPGLHGSQAEFVRVPLADGSLVQLPDEVSNEAGVLLGDILSTAFFCAENGGIRHGDAVVVVGCGPVGLLAVMAARELGAGQVLAVDGVASRRAAALALGASAAVDPAGAPEAVHTATDGRGADVVLEVVGGSGQALSLAFQLLRPAGTLSSVGVHTDASFPFSPVDGYNKNLTYRSGRCPARHYMAQLLPLMQAGKLPCTSIITHRLTLTEGVAAYRMFDRKEDGCIKVVLRP